MERVLCLWLLIVCIVCTFGLSYGLTYRSNHHCYAGVCGSWLFPTQARRHVIVWYSWLSISVAFLSLRALVPRVRKLTSMQTGVWVPLMGKRLTLGGLMLVFWQCALYGILVGIWWPRLDDYFQERGEGLPGNALVAFVAQSGHLADVTTGLVLLPVTRHGALAAFFKLEPSTNFIFHMTEAYIVFLLILVHGLSYVGWVSLYNAARDSFRYIFPVLNPTYLYCEVWPGNSSSLGIWRASLIFSGIVSATIMAAMFLTSFPIVRRKYFNLFYFTHLLAIPAIIIICLHASTMLYCTAPGLSMWVLDWGLRAIDLRKKLDGRLTALGKGWYGLKVSIPRTRLAGRNRGSPLAHFHIHHSASSKFELHPFTTTTHLDSAPVVYPNGDEHVLVNFLFREMENKSATRPLQPSAKKRKQWTTRLAALTDEETVIGSLQATDSDKALIKERGNRDIIFDAHEDNESAHRSRIPSLKFGNDNVFWMDEHSSGSNSPRRSGDIPALIYSEAEMRWINAHLEHSSGQTTMNGSLSSFHTSRATSISEKQADGHRDGYSAHRIADGSVALKLRLEGPYFTAAKPMSYKTVLCLVAGTGVTGAIAIAEAFQAHRRTAKGLVQCPRCMEDPRSPTRWQRCAMLWVVREDDFVEIPAINALQCDGLDIRIHKTGQGKSRPDLQGILQEYCGSKGDDSWCYVCGPPGFVASAERACMNVKGLTWCATA